MLLYDGTEYMYDEQNTICSELGAILVALETPGEYQAVNAWLKAESKVAGQKLVW